LLVLLVGVVVAPKRKIKVRGSQKEPKKSARLKQI